MGICVQGLGVQGCRCFKTENRDQSKDIDAKMPDNKKGAVSPTCKFCQGMEVKPKTLKVQGQRPLCVALARHGAMADREPESVSSEFEVSRA